MEVDLDELTRNSLVTPYKEEVGALFKVMVLNMSTGTSTDEAVASYLRGIETAQRAFKIATVASYLRGIETAQRAFKIATA